MCVCVVCVYVCVCLCVCLSVRSTGYCTGLFVWGLEVCAHLVVGGVCVAEVCGGELSCWGLCVFVIKSVCRLWVFSVVVRLG